MDGELKFIPNMPRQTVCYGDRRFTINRLLYYTVLSVGLALFIGGFYLMPIGTDMYLYFFVEIVAHGNWLMGSILANLVCVAIIVAGLLLLRAVGKRPSLSNSGGDAA